MAETINGLHKTEVIRRRGPWRTLEAVEFATLEWVDWFNHRRMLEPIGNIPPAEAEARYYAQIEDVAMAAWLKPNGLRQNRGGSKRLLRRPLESAIGRANVRSWGDGVRQPIRILHILSELRHSGMEAMLVSAAPHFIEQGVVSDILATGAELGRFAPHLQRAGYTVRHVPFARSPLFLWRAYQAMRGGYGAIHIHTEGAGFWLGMAARLAGVPSVVRTIHGAFAFEGALRWRRLIQRQALRWLGIRHVAIGSSVQDNERRRFLLPTTRINNWYDDQRFTPTTGAQRLAARAALGLAADTATLVSIGNCGRVKNHRAILEALSMLPAEKRPLYLHVGAEEADEPERRLAQSLGVTAWVRFLGAQDDVCQALRAADLFIMPSLHEGLGNAALEALATGLPCILADVPGLRDFQKDFPGILYTKPDPMPVADAIVRAFDGLAELRQLAAHAHPRAALLGFSAKKGVADYAALYRATSR